MAKILIIEDDTQFRQMLRQVLQRADYDVLEAANGKEGIQRFSQEPADLIITDLIMPEKEGIETILQLKQEHPNVKIFAISGGGRLGPRSYLDLAQKLGALRTFSKPLDRQALLDAVGETLTSCNQT